MKSKYVIFLGLFITVMSGCEKTLDVKMTSGVYSSSNLFTKADGAHTAMRGIYESMTTGGFSGKTNPLVGVFSGSLGLSSDELIRNSYDANQQLFLDNNLVPEHSTVAGIWASLYNYIYQANMLYENVENSPAINQKAKDELMGEARFIRGMSYFYLTNVFGKVPLALTSDYITNAILPVSTQDKVYEQVVADLKFAQNNMTATNFMAIGTKIRANRWAATAFLARVYLYRKDWANAELQANELLKQTTYKLELLENVFLSTSTEAIWQLANPGANLYTAEGSLISGTAATNSAFRLSPYVVSLFSAGDQRISKWTRAGTGTGLGTVAPFKYKTFSNTQVGAKKELSTPIRLAEIYLIRAEARAMQGDLAGAIKDLDEIRKRAGAVGDDNAATGNDKIPFKTIAYAYPAIQKTELIELIYEERLREFFAENGHRWFDAKRSGKPLATFFGSRKSSISETDAFFPIPANDLKFNPNLDPTDGY